VTGDGRRGAMASKCNRVITLNGTTRADLQYQANDGVRP